MKTVIHMPHRVTVTRKNNAEILNEMETWEIAQTTITIGRKKIENEGHIPFLLKGTQDLKLDQEITKTLLYEKSVDSEGHILDQNRPGENLQEERLDRLRQRKGIERTPYSRIIQRKGGIVRQTLKKDIMINDKGQEPRHHRQGNIAHGRMLRRARKQPSLVHRGLFSSHILYSVLLCK